MTDCGSHECQLTCVRCGFCVHSFLCNCNEHQHKGNFCIHLHLLSNIKQQLPFFEKPINKRLDIYNRLKEKKTIEQSEPTAAAVNQPSASSDLTISKAESSTSLESSNEAFLEKGIPQLDFDDYCNDDLDASNWDSDDNLKKVSDDSTTSTLETIPIEPAKTIPIEFPETCASSYDNVSRLIETYRHQLKNVDRNSTSQSLKSNLDELYQILHTGISVLPKGDPVPNLASLASKSKKRKLTEEDKQIRLVSYSKSKAGRKPLKKLAKPISPEKSEILNSLMTPTKKKKKDDAVDGTTRVKSKRGRPAKKLDFVSASDSTKASDVQLQPKPKRGRPPKSSVNIAVSAIKKKYSSKK